MSVGVLDRLGVAYTVAGMNTVLFWYRSYAPAVDSACPWAVCFMRPEWSDLQPWLYHAGFDAGYASEWPTVGWRRPNREIPTTGRVTLTDTEFLSGCLWGQMAAGIAVEPVEPRVRSQFRRLGFELYISGDPPEDPVGRAEWLLAAEYPQDSGIVESRRVLARRLIQAELNRFFKTPTPVWAGHLQRLQAETRAQAVSWGFSVPKVGIPGL